MAGETKTLDQLDAYASTEFLPISSITTLRQHHPG